MDHYQTPQALLWFMLAVGIFAILVSAIQLLPMRQQMRHRTASVMFTRRSRWSRAGAMFFLGSGLLGSAAAMAWPGNWWNGYVFFLVIVMEISVVVLNLIGLYPVAKEVYRDLFGDSDQR